MINKTLKTGLFAIAVLLIAFFSFKFLFFSSQENEGSKDFSGDPEGYMITKEFVKSENAEKNYNPKNEFSTATYMTNDSSEDLVDYYRSLLQEDGWTIESDTDLGGGYHRFYASNDGNSVNIYIEEGSLDDINNIDIPLQRTVSIHLTPPSPDPTSLNQIDLEEIYEQTGFTPKQ